MEFLNVQRLKQAAGRYTPPMGGTPEAFLGGTRQAARQAARRRAQAAPNERARAMVQSAEAAQPQAAPARAQPETLRMLARERIIGSDDLRDINYLEMAVAIARGVARVKIGGGAGTGSLVGPRVLMTNNHVIGSEAEGRLAVAQFDYQENISGDLLPVHNYRLDPDLFFLTDSTLDFTLIGVTPISEKGRALTEYPWLPLRENRVVAKEDPVNIIQHPRGGLKQIALRNNEVIELPPGAPSFVHYTTDTEPGSSGSPCFNDDWEVVALHHSGVPRLDPQGNVLKRDGTVFRDGDDGALIDWIANEGALVAAIVKFLRAVSLNPQRSDVRAQMLEAPPPNPIEVARSRKDAPPVVPPDGAAPLTVVPGAGRVTFTIPLTVTVELGQAAAPASVAAAAATIPAPSAEDELLEAVRIDPDWAGRKGYDPDFLGQRVPLPKLSTAQKRNTVVVPPEFTHGGDKHVFPYHHYSVAMNKSRRFAWYSAANVDGDRRPKLPKRRDKWFIDPRIDDPTDPKVQCGEPLYATGNTDRGHLTRYLDAAWGNDLDEAKAAAADTFHFSNCCLQLSGFNQSSNRWQGLEQFLLENKARREKRRINVFTGPVFHPADPFYRNEHMDFRVRIPLRFWKVCVIERQDGTLAATGFVLGQEDVASLPGFEEKLDVEMAQVTLADLEDLTGLNFGKTKDHDHFAAGGAPGTLEIARESGGKRKVLPIGRLEDIVL